MDFPECWDGRLDSPDHKEHVVYSNDDDERVAPHDMRIPTLSISIYIQNCEASVIPGPTFLADFIPII